MKEDKNFCMSHFLMYRTLAETNKTFKKGITPNIWKRKEKTIPINSSVTLHDALQKQINSICQNKPVALALSGGIDSAILAKLVSKDTTAYTFKCIVPGIKVLDESIVAAQYAKECNIKHKIIEIYWDDFEKYSPLLMKHKGAPIHSIEVQIYKAAIQAKQDGFDTIIFGESADLNYGGLSDLLSRDYTIGQFIDRYSYVLPHHILKEPQIINTPCLPYLENGKINVHEFCRGFFLTEAMGSYSNACECANIKLETPYVNTRLLPELDIERIRNGENKYIIRELFNLLYPNWKIPPKTPMPRPMNEWMKNWQGPKRPEFFSNSITNMTGDQKWYIWILEQFLNLIEN